MKKKINSFFYKNSFKKYLCFGMNGVLESRYKWENINGIFNVLRLKSTNIGK